MVRQDCLFAHANGYTCKALTHPYCLDSADCKFWCDVNTHYFDDRGFVQKKPTIPDTFRAKKEERGLGNEKAR